MCLLNGTQLNVGGSDLRALYPIRNNPNTRGSLLLDKVANRGELVNSLLLLVCSLTRDGNMKQCLHNN